MSLNDGLIGVIHLNGFIDEPMFWDRILTPYEMCHLSGGSWLRCFWEIDGIGLLILIYLVFLWLLWSKKASRGKKW